MNDRIKLLAFKAADGMLSYDGEGEWRLSQKEVEKFADSIVQECIHILNKRYMGDNNREDMEVKRCIEDVKNHFGIE